jgi:hypothetical protein
VEDIILFCRHKELRTFVRTLDTACISNHMLHIFILVIHPVLELTDVTGIIPGMINDDPLIYTGDATNQDLTYWEPSWMKISCCYSTQDVKNLCAFCRTSFISRLLFAFLYQLMESGDSVSVRGVTWTCKALWLLYVLTKILRSAPTQCT